MQFRLIHWKSLNWFILSFFLQKFSVKNKLALETDQVQISNKALFILLNDYKIFYDPKKECNLFWLNTYFAMTCEVIIHNHRHTDVIMTFFLLKSFRAKDPESQAFIFSFLMRCMIIWRTFSTLSLVSKFISNYLWISETCSSLT